MERRGFRIPEKSGCVRGIVICAAVMFATQFFGLYIMLGGGILEFPSEVLWEHIAFAGTNQ